MTHILEDLTRKMEGQPPKKDGIWVLGIYFMNHPMNSELVQSAFRLHPSSSNNLKSSRWRVRWDDLGFFSWLWAMKKRASFCCLVDKQWMNYYPVMWGLSQKPWNKNTYWFDSISWLNLNPFLWTTLIHHTHDGSMGLVYIDACTDDRFLWSINRSDPFQGRL